MDDTRSRAIVVLDMTNHFAHKEGAQFSSAFADTIPFIQGELQYFRERMRTVIFCNTKINVDDSFGARVVQSLSPRTGEITITKPGFNAFFGTSLLTLLNNQKIKNLTIVGAFSHTSVISTARAALDHEFSVVVPETCVCAPDAGHHQAALRLILAWLNEG